ncbi:hypothetical protein ABK040_008639 [Willaertia magna]
MSKIENPVTNIEENNNGDLKEKSTQQTPTKINPKTLTIPQNFLYSAISGMISTTVNHPSDVLKTTMQLMGENKPGVKVGQNPFPIAIDLVKREGFSKLYVGLTAALLRQATYGATRLGVFQVTMDYLNSKYQSTSFFTKWFVGLMSGGIAAFVGCPSDLALIRMVSGKYTYNHVFDALYKICRDEGVARMWRGSSPTVIRAMIFNSVQLSTYAQSKQILLENGIIKSDNMNCHIISSLIASLFSSAASLPVDLAKTKLQSMKDVIYKNSFDVMQKTVRQEGVMALWKGFWPFYLRQGPHAVLTFVILEQFRLHFGK